MPRGELIGEAWVRVHADTSGIDNDVRRGMASADFEKEGAKGGDKWSEGFAKSVDDQLVNRLRSTFKQGFITGDFSSFAKQFDTTSEAIDHAGAQLDEMRDKGHLTELQFQKLSDVLATWGVDDQIRKASVETERLNKVISDQDKAYQSYAKNRLVADERTAKAQAEQEAAWQSYATNRLFDERKLSRSQEDQQKAWNTYGQNVLSTGEREARSIDYLGEKWDEHGRRIRPVFKDVEKGTRDVEQSVDSLGKKTKDFDIGGLFGKGARNNFVNLVGIIVGGVAEMGLSLGRFAEKGLKGVEDAFSSLSDTFSGFREAGSGVFAALAKTGAQAFAGLVSSLASLGPAAIAGAAAILLLNTAIGVLVSTASLLVGGITAVASAISFGLAGAALAAAPVLVGLGAAVGVTLVAFKDMSKGTQKEMDVLKKRWTDMATHVSDVFFKDLPTWIKEATSLLKTFVGPTMSGVAEAMRTSISGLLNILTSADFAPFLQVWQDTLPKIVGSLTDAIGKAAAGLIALFKPVLPYAERLAAKIDELATSFFNWATSAEGQNSVADFMTKAWQAARSLWGILTSVGSALGTIFSAGQESGQSFLTWADTKLSGWADHLKTPEGQADLKKWFDDAKQFGKDLITTIGNIGTALQNLDTPENRKFATDLVEALSGVTTAMADVQKVLQGDPFHFDFKEEDAPLFHWRLCKSANKMNRSVRQHQGWFSADQGVYFRNSTGRECRSGSLLRWERLRRSS